MTTRFKRKTLAVSIAAALFGGMALAVAPVMTPIAWANQFEASALGPRSSNNLFTGDPTNVDETKTGSIVIQELGEWEDGQFIVTFPEGTRFWDLVQNKMVDDPIAPDALAKSFYIDDSNGVEEVVFSSARYNSANQLEVTFSAKMVASSNPRSFRFTAYLSSPTVGDFRVKIADDPNDRVGLDTLAGQPDNGIKIAKFYNTSVWVNDEIPPTSVQSGLTNQLVANIETELLTTIPAVPQSRILFTLDNGKWLDGVTLSGPSGTLNKLNDTQLELVNDKEWVPHNWATLSNLKINAVDVPTDTDINVTVTSQGGNGYDAIPNFGIHKVKVGQTGSASGQGVNVSLVKTGSDFQTLYAGRYFFQTLSDTVKLTETRPASLIENGTLNYTLSTGVFYNEEEQPTSQGFNALTWTMDPTGTGGLGAACEPTPAGAKAANCWVESASSATAGTLGFLPPMWIDLRDVTTEGDLQVTIDGTAWNSWTDNVVKVAEIIRATESTLDGDVALVRLSPNSIVSATLPDIVIQETRAGALLGRALDGINGFREDSADSTGRPIVLGLDDGMKLIAPADAVARVFDKNGNEVPGGLLITPTALMEPGDIVTDSHERGVDVWWPDLPAANGPYRIVVSGLQVRTQLAGRNVYNDADNNRAGGVTPVKDYNLTVAGSFTQRIIDERSQSDTGAKPFMQSFKVASVIDSAKAWLDVEGPITEQTIYSNILPSSADLGKMGSYYLMLQMPPQFTGDWSIWTLGPTGWTKVEPATTDEGLCSTMTSYQSGVLENVTNWPLIVPAADMTAFEGVRVWMGYGVGATLLKPLAPCLDMLKNGTYWYVYTVE